MLHGTNVEIIEAQQASLCKCYKNTKPELHKTNVAVWFNKTFKMKRSNGKDYNSQTQQYFMMYLKYNNKTTFI